MIKIKLIEYTKKSLLMKLIMWKYKSLLKFLEKNVNYILVTDNGKLDGTGGRVSE